MTDIPTDAEIEAVRRDIGRWLDANLVQPDFDLPQTFMGVSNDRQFRFLRDWQKRLHEAGFIGMSWPERFGGRGMHQMLQDAATHEMKRRRAHPMLNTVALFWAGPLILELGTEAMKEQHIAGILSADDLWCQGFSEPDHGSDLASITTRAVRDGDDYVINGSKIWTSLATYANHMILIARTDPDPASRYRGMSFFLCPMDAPGIEVRPIRKITGEYGFAQVFFTDARISASRMMGKEGEGWNVAMRALSYERATAGGQGGGPISTYRTAAADVIAFAKRQRSDGTIPVADPLVRDRLVRFAIDEAGMNLNHSRQRVPALVSEYPMAIPLMNKLVDSEYRLDITRFAAELLGPSGSGPLGHDETGQPSWMLDYFNNFSGTIGGGSSQIQRNIIGERVLGLAKD
ncbi:MAG: acyl-CoA dehydrogenase family protein [Sphingobium sp.]